MNIHGIIPFHPIEPYMAYVQHFPYNLPILQGLFGNYMANILPRNLPFASFSS